MRIKAAGLAHELVVGIRAGEPGLENPKGPTLFPALHNVINTEFSLPQAALLPESHHLLFAHILFRPKQGHFMIERKMFHPGLIILAALAHQFLGDLGVAANVPEEIDHLVFPHQPQQVPVDDNSIKTVINPLQIRPKELKKQLHRCSPVAVKACSLPLNLGEHRGLVSFEDRTQPRSPEMIRRSNN